MPLKSQHLTIRSGRLPQSNIKRRYLLTYGSFEIRVGYATCGLRREKSSLPAIRKMTVRMVSSRV